MKKRLAIVILAGLSSFAWAMEDALGAPDIYMAGDSIMADYTPDWFPQYGWGQNDPAHIRESGAFFYARGAVEMAREQGLPLAEKWKETESAKGL